MGLVYFAELIITVSKSKVQPKVNSSLIFNQRNDKKRTSGRVFIARIIFPWVFRKSFVPNLITANFFFLTVFAEFKRKKRVTL